MVVFGGEPAPWGQLVPSPRGSEPALYEPAVPPDVPSAPVDSGHARTATVGACALYAAGSAIQVQSDGASQARDGPLGAGSSILDAPLKERWLTIV
jgi:hypothetical protein